MSKQSDAKIKQGYVPKPDPKTCGSCKNLRIDMEHPAWMKDGKHDEYLKRDDMRRETNVRCGLGEFAVKKLGTCNMWIIKCQ